MKIWIDADACPKPVKELVFKTSFRQKVEVTLVANSFLSVPSSPLIHFVQVEQGADEADFYIVKTMSAQDLVITADIPLAAAVVEKGGVAVNPRGEFYTEENIRERLSIRDFMQELRDGGVQTGGPKPFGAKDKELFANTLNKFLSQNQVNRS